MVKRLPRSYLDCVEIFEEHPRCRQRGKLVLCNNTTLERYEDDEESLYCGVLHNTGIVTFRSDGMILLYMGGHDTVTTRSRIRRCLPHGWDIGRVVGETWLFYEGEKFLRMPTYRTLVIYESMQQTMQHRVLEALKDNHLPKG